MKRQDQEAPTTVLWNGALWTIQFREWYGNRYCLARLAYATDEQGHCKKPGCTVLGHHQHSIQIEHPVAS